MIQDDVQREYFFKEIDLIQSIIKRMASNSFLIKGWAITLVVVTMLLKSGSYQIYIAFIPLVVFWILDAYFLKQERMYRRLYDWVIKNRATTDEHLLDMNAKRFEKQVQPIVRTMFSITLGWFYGSIIVLIIAYFILRAFMNWGGC